MHYNSKPFFDFIFFTMHFLTWCSVECKHIYEKKAVMNYIRLKKQNARCPVAGILFLVFAAKFNLVLILIIFWHISCQLVLRSWIQKRWCVTLCYLSKSRKCAHRLSKLLLLMLLKISLSLTKNSMFILRNHSRASPDLECICYGVRAICPCLLDSNDCITGR